MPRDQIQQAGAVLEAARGTSRYTSTQENAWMVLAAQAMIDDTKALSLTVDGTPRSGMLFRALRRTSPSTSR